SSDSDGTISSYQWNGTPDPDDVVSPSVSLGIGVHQFSLIVTDNVGASSSPATVTITVEALGPQSAPLVTVEEEEPSDSETPEFTVTEGENLTFSVSATDPDGDPVSLTASP